MRIQTTALRTAPAALAILSLLAACDQAKNREHPDSSKPISAGGAAAPAAPAAAMPSASVPPISAGLTLRPEFPGFYLDRINAAADPLKTPATISAAGPIEMTGFGYDAVAKAPSKGIDLDIDGKLYGAVYGAPRADVATYFKNPALGAVGFRLVLPAGALAPGPHRVFVRPVTADGTGYYQSPAISFIVQ